MLNVPQLIVLSAMAQKLAQLASTDFIWQYTLVEMLAILLRQKQMLATVLPVMVIAFALLEPLNVQTV